MMEGLNPDGTSFNTKVIRAKRGFLHFPIFNPNHPGSSRANIRGWVKTRQVTFRPRPSLQAVAVKYAPVLEDAVSDAVEQAAKGAA